MLSWLEKISPELPVLIAGPTASGKSALALELADRQGGTIVNADALQVYNCWRVLSARPSAEEESQAPHLLYGHIPYDQAYSTGQWLREIEPLLQSPNRPIIVGGTGLNFTALTKGLAQIPDIPPQIRAEADALERSEMLEQIDATTAGRLDQMNRARVQRAWEVQRATGRALSDWQDSTPPPLLPLRPDHAVLLDAPKDWLTPRIEHRFDLMLEHGALDEAKAMLPHWDPARPSSKAIGAPELIAHLLGEMSLEQAKAAAIIATRQYAKRQRTWFRSKMSDWTTVTPGKIAQ